MSNVGLGLNEYPAPIVIKLLLAGQSDFAAISDIASYKEINAIDQQNRDVDEVIISRPLNSGEGIAFIITDHDKHMCVRLRILMEATLAGPKIRVIDEQNGQTQIAGALFLYRSGYNEEIDQIFAEISEWGGRGGGVGVLDASKTVAVGLPSIKSVSRVGPESTKIFPVIRLNNKNQLTIAVPHVMAATKRHDAKPVESFRGVYVKALPY